MKVIQSFKASSGITQKPSHCKSTKSKLLQLADEEQLNNENAAKILKQSVYVGDILFGGQDENQTKQTKNELVDLMAKGGLQLQGWANE